MPPHYVLPARESGRNINFDTKPKQVDAWVKRLPLTHPFNAAESVADYLVTLNRTEIEHDVGAKIILRIAPVAQDLIAALNMQYDTAPLPLLPHQQRHADLASRLWDALAECYKILLLAWLKQRFHLFGHKPVALYLQQILLALQAILEISLKTHNPVPKRAWIDLHQTYHYARLNGLNETIPEGCLKMLSIEHIYKATLLQAMADPYRIPRAEFPWTKDLIARFSHLTTLAPAHATVKDHAHLFMVDVSTDKPPAPITRDAHALNPQQVLLIDTAALAKHLTRLSTHLENPESLDKINVPEVAHTPAYITLLRQLKSNWGAASQRQSPRRHQENGRDYEVGFGFKSVFQLIAPALKSESKPTAIPTLVHCKTINDSMGGLALSKTDDTPIQIDVGDIVAIRHEKTDWSVGLVRWFRVTNQGEVFFGIQLLAPRALAVQVTRKDNGRQRPGLLLHPVPNTKQTPTLLTLPGCFVSDLVTEIHTPKGKQLMRIEKRIESTPSVELFRFQIHALDSTGLQMLSITHTEHN